MLCCFRHNRILKLFEGQFIFHLLYHRVFDHFFLYNSSIFRWQINCYRIGQRSEKRWKMLRKKKKIDQCSFNPFWWIKKLKKIFHIIFPFSGWRWQIIFERNMYLISSQAWFSRKQSILQKNFILYVE